MKQNWFWAVIFVTTYLSSVFAAPPPKGEVVNGPNEIKDSDFTKTIAEGTWWIKFFSPYCPHCVHLAPYWNEAWDKVQAEKADSQYNFHMASVNCVTDGDLCDRQGIQGYPTLRLFHNGEMIEDWRERDRTTSKILDYAHQAMNETEMAEKFTLSPATATKNIEEASNEAVNSLTYDEFLSSVGKSGTPWLIKFFSPKCPHCNKMAPEWKRLQPQLRGSMKLAEVNCDVQRQLCKDMGVKSIPDIYYFDGPAKIHYEGRSKFDEMLAFAKQLDRAGVVQEVRSKTELDSTIHKNKADGIVGTILYIYDESSTKEDWTAIKKASLSLHGKVAFVKTPSSSPVGQDFKSDVVPIFKGIVGKDHVVDFPGREPSEYRDVHLIKNWANELWLHNVPQLTAQNAEDTLTETDYVVIGFVRDKAAKANVISQLQSAALNYISDRERQDNIELEEKRRKKQVKIDKAVEKDDEDAESRAKRIEVRVGPRPTVGFVWLDLHKEDTEDWAITRFGGQAVQNSEVIINSNPRGLFWAQGVHGSGIAASSPDISEAVQAVLVSSAKIHEQVLFLGLRSLPHMVRWYLTTHKSVTFVLVIIILLMANRRRRRLSHRKTILPLAGKRE